MISVIIPVYNEADNLKMLNAELNKVLDSLTQDSEIIYIDDYSKDGSFNVLGNLTQTNSRIKVIQLSRHYGQTEAMQAGIDNAQGDILLFMDADMQNDPRDIPKLLAKIEEGFDVVSGWRRNRKDPLFTRRIPSYLANWLISYFSKVKIHDFGCTLKAYRKEVIGPIRLYSQMHRFIPIYAARKGASIAEIEVSHRKRIHGRSKYGLNRTILVVLDFFTAEFINEYLNKPMYVFGVPGFILIGLGTATGILIIVRKIFFAGVWVSPLMFIMVMLIIVGFQLILMGLLAEVFIRLYFSNTKELTYNIREIIGKK